MSATPNLYQEIEDLEVQLDACVSRIRDLEEHVRVEIGQQNEVIHKLRSQLRRTLAAVSELHLPTPGDGPAPPSDEGSGEAEAAVPYAIAGSLPNMEFPAALASDDEADVTFDDPFALILPEPPIEIEEEVEPGAPFVEAESFVGEEETYEEEARTDTPVAEQNAAEPYDEFEEAEPAPEEAAAEEIAGPVAAGEPVEAEPAAEAPAEEEDVEARLGWGQPLNLEAMSGFIIPADAFSSTLDEEPDSASDPVAEAPPSDEKTPEQPKPLSEFDRLLDWSDFEPEAHDEEPAESDVLDTPSGDGMTATRAPSPPTVRQERPVAITRKTPPTDPVAAAIRKGGQDLTVITGIDDEMQIALRRLGVTTLDEIASWHPADAERYAQQLGTVSEREIFDVWVLEAQSALFELFQQRLRTNRFHNLDEI